MARKTRHAHITHSESGTSVFDPVLCELAYRWFSPPDGLVLDPFAGGSVRGVVANLTGRRYVGIDLSATQCEANRQQARTICGSEPMPRWITGDSRNIERLMKSAKAGPADLVFSCPPYGDLEAYSDDPADLSNMNYPEFRRDYAEIIRLTVSQLKKDRFAVWVVGEFRDKASGTFHNFVGDTISAFMGAGAAYYNSAILVQPVGNQRLRAGKAFENSRKLGMTHAHVLVFVKGDPKAATEACGECEFEDIENSMEEAA